MQHLHDKTRLKSENFKDTSNSKNYDNNNNNNNLISILQSFNALQLTR